MKSIPILAALSFACCAASAAHAIDLPGIPAFIDEMVAKHQFERAELESAFDRAQHQPKVIETISKPSVIRPWMEYRGNFVNPQRIKLGVAYWKKYQQSLQRAEQQYGVPQEIILAVIGVETIYGADVGTYRTLDALSTLAFDYPRRAEFFRDELENFLLLAREQNYDMLVPRGSYAGALGIPQFMPSSYRRYAVDFNDNHKIDLQGEPDDAIGSVAHYLQGYGWQAGEPVAMLAHVSVENCPGEILTPRTLSDWASVGIVAEGESGSVANARLMDFTVSSGKEFWLGFNNFDVITRYNNSDFYAMTVFQLAQEIVAARRNSTLQAGSAAGNVASDGETRRAGAKKRDLQLVYRDAVPHQEPLSNADMPSSAVLQSPAKR